MANLHRYRIPTAANDSLSESESSSSSSSSSSLPSSPGSLSRSGSSTTTYTLSSATSTTFDDDGSDSKPVPSSSKNPHLPPDFTNQSLFEHGEPILYLPPLISSLPETYPPHNHSPSRPGKGPLITSARLPSINPASVELHKALHHFHPWNAEYAAQPYAEGFNWSELSLPEDVEGEWYCVAFRSKRKAGSDSGPLYAADQKAHEEAVSNGGLIMYWYGTPHAATGINMATCVWQSREHAIAANSRPHHIQAMKLAAASYEMYDLERYTLRKTVGETVLHVEDYAGGVVPRVHK